MLLEDWIIKNKDYLEGSTYLLAIGGAILKGITHSYRRFKNGKLYKLISSNIWNYRSSKLFREIIKNKYNY